MEIPLFDEEFKKLIEDNEDTKVKDFLNGMFDEPGLERLGDLTLSEFTNTMRFSPAYHIDNEDCEEFSRVLNNWLEHWTFLEEGYSKEDSPIKEIGGFYDIDNSDEVTAYFCNISFDELGQDFIEEPLIFEVNEIINRSKKSRENFIIIDKLIGMYSNETKEGKVACHFGLFVSNGRAARVFLDKGLNTKISDLKRQLETHTKIKQRNFEIEIQSRDYFLENTEFNKFKQEFNSTWLKKMEGTFED